MKKQVLFAIVFAISSAGVLANDNGAENKVDVISIKEPQASSKITPELIKSLNIQGANVTKNIAMKLSEKFGGRANAIEYAEVVDSLVADKYPE
ncbi:hypothetical protein ACFKAH_003519 [Vibrio parahaemolyticus]|nr:hypothetical protein [Vibrio vulnificus]EGQ8892076.1 hypothetical protein [Vibrio parahaemolyticus]MCS0331012.1 hypothetical protein [Vibrio diabolicus]ARN69104.1 hypothetical protein FORC36_4587 [Vibrio vulnificus]EGR3309134.1 hypothetical protein [Vibrio parahaemolyticus]KOF25551.1 hypothetical protein ACX13_22415 [Vibrio parahaemolyticus]